MPTDANPAYGAHLMAYAGIPTFMRRPATRDLQNGDVAIVGVPYDGGATSYRSGARLGPRHIREASLHLWGYHSVLRVAPLQALRLLDYGDVAVSPADIAQTMAQIEAEVGAVLDAGATAIALGGDHSVTLPLLRAHAARFGPLAVVHFDAHADMWAGRYDHATTFRYALEEGLIDAPAYIQVGIRGPVVTDEDVRVAERWGAHVLTIDDCFARGMPAVIEVIRGIVLGRRVYISLDLDAADPAYAPGVGTPEVGGFTSYQMLQLMRGLRGLDLIGLDLVEVSPPYDPSGITSILAANLAFEYLALLALRKAEL